MRRRLAAVAVVLGACFRPQAAPQHDAPIDPADAALSDAALPDAALPDAALPDAPAPLDAAPVDGPCTWSAFGPARHLDELATSVDETGAWLSDDRLEIAFTSGNQMFHALRATPASPFDAPERFQTGVFGRHFEPAISADGHHVYFSTTHGLIPTATPIVYVGTRADRGAVLSDVHYITEMIGGESIIGIDLAPNQRDAIVEGNISGIPTSDLYIWHRAAPDAPFTSDEAVAFPTEDLRSSPEVLGDGAILFASATTHTLMRFDTATIAPLAPELAPPAGSSNADGRLTSDGATLVFASDRPGGAGGLDLYEADRTCP